MARSWNFFFKSSIAGAILWGFTLLWTGQGMAQDENNQSSEIQSDQVQAVQYEGDDSQTPFFEESEPADQFGPADASLKEAMDEIRKAYLMQQYNDVLDLCQNIRRNFPGQVNRLEFYEKVSQRRLEALAKRQTEDNPYPRISELLPELPSDETKVATPGTLQQATGAPASGANGVSPQAMPLPPSMAPAPPRPAPPSGLMTTLTTLPIWMYAVIGAVIIALILLVLKLVMGGKSKTATTATADENADQSAEASASDEGNMFDPLGGLSDSAGADDPFATVASGSDAGASDDPFGAMFDEVKPQAEAPAPQEMPQENEEPVETPAQDFSAFESLLDTKADEPKPQQAFNPETGPINFSFDDDDIQETIQAPLTPAESGVESIMDVFGNDEGPADLPAQQLEEPVAENDVEDILTFDGIEESTSGLTSPQEADTKMEDSVSDVFDDDFSISLDQPMAENTAMQETQAAQPPIQAQTSADEDADGEDLLLFDEASDNTNIANLHIDETIDLDGNDSSPAEGSGEATVEQTLISPLRPLDLDGPSSQMDDDNTSSDLFDKERQAGEQAFNDNDWKGAVHHLTIAAALQPESAEVKALLREASRQNKTEAGVSER